MPQVRWWRGQEPNRPMGRRCEAERGRRLQLFFLFFPCASCTPYVGARTPTRTQVHTRAPPPRRGRECGVWRGGGGGALHEAGAETSRPARVCGVRVRVVVVVLFPLEHSSRLCPPLFSVPLPELSLTRASPRSANAPPTLVLPLLPLLFPYFARARRSASSFALLPFLFCTPAASSPLCPPQATDVWGGCACLCVPLYHRSMRAAVLLLCFASCVGERGCPRRRRKRPQQHSGT